MIENRPVQWYIIVDRSTDIDEGLCPPLDTLAAPSFATVLHAPRSSKRDLQVKGRLVVRENRFYQ